MHLHKDDHIIRHIYQELAKTDRIILAHLEDRIWSSTDCFWPVIYAMIILHTTGCKAKAEHAVW